MSAAPFESAVQRLTEIQREAVDWQDRALLVLAGPGSGKTQVLTCRIARLLEGSRDKSFRVLALTFTNKAADEMKSRVATFVPGLEERATIGTFHSFCGQMLRQHGVHVGIRPDFAIYASDDDRKEVLEDGLRRARAAGRSVALEDVKYIPVIDDLKARLIAPDAALAFLGRRLEPERVVEVYRIYEEELQRLNALDFNSLILEAHRLITAFPAIAARYRRSYPYWLVDEFQDTNEAQYALIRGLAGDDFRNVFAVADDDQIIYEWNGASFQQVQRFASDFAAETVQLPTNYRCPPSIVRAANRLVTYNANRAAEKAPLVAGKNDLKLPDDQHIQLRVFADDDTEAQEIAAEIARDRERWGSTAVLARRRSLLVKMQGALARRGVSAVIGQRRDEFLSAELRWLNAVLNQAIRPLDRRNVGVLIDAFSRLSGVMLNVDEIAAQAEATGRGYLATWIEAVDALGLSGRASQLAGLVRPIVTDASAFRSVADAVIEALESQDTEADEEADLAEDLDAWRELKRDITAHIGRGAPLEQFLQELQMRSKEPTPKPGTVTLMTIHGAKGREFDFVYVVGLAEDVMPSFQSLKKGERSAEMEEERRNCFVAITRAKECLILSRAVRYSGWPKAPSRFLGEMGIAD